MEEDAKAALLAAYGRLLRPLVRILLRNRVSFAEFTGVAKQVFVTTALQQTDASEEEEKRRSRVAIITGVPAAEVAAVLAKKGEQELTRILATITRVLSGWHTDAEFTGPYGLPLELRLNDSPDRSFIELTHRYAPGIDPRPLLDELIRIGVVKETEKGWFRVLTRTYLPKVDALESIERLGDAVEHFVDTVDFNRQEDDPEQRLFERIVVADDGISEEDLPRFKRYIRDRAQILLEEIDNWLSRLEKPRNASTKKTQTGVGIYHYVVHQEDEP